MRPLVFVESSRDELRAFPTGWSLRTGSSWRKWVRVSERSVSMVFGEWRVLYVAKFAKAVFVLRAFRKKTQKTRQEDVALAHDRYRQIGEQT